MLYLNENHNYRWCNTPAIIIIKYEDRLRLNRLELSINSSITEKTDRYNYRFGDCRSLNEVPVPLTNRFADWIIHFTNYFGSSLQLGVRTRCYMEPPEFSKSAAFLSRRSPNFNVGWSPYWLPATRCWQLNDSCDYETILKDELRDYSAA